jgi:hypothetical protein
MRTTISIDDELGEAARKRAAEQGLSLSAFVAEALREALTRPSSLPEAPRFRLVTVGGGGPLEGVDLDRPRALETLEDERQFGG